MLTTESDAPKGGPGAKANLPSPDAGDWQFRLILAGLGGVAALPLLLYGFTFHAHDTVCHLRWAHHFSAGFWSGTVYPRWLPDINFGCGSPSFFYYPPAPYWAASLFTPLAGTDWQALGWASALGLILSGQAAYGCFRALAPSAPAFLVAALYLIAPYHLAIDLVERGAYAEFWAFVWMPLALGGLIRLTKDEPWAWEKLVFGLALLFMTHLPTTLTFMLFVLLFALSRGVRLYARACGAIVAACALAAVFLVPALTTQGYTNLRRNPFPYELTFFFPTLDLRAPLYSMDPFNQRLLWIFCGLAAVWLLCYALALVDRLTWGTGRMRLTWLALGLIVMLMMLPVSNLVYRLIPVFQWIQFSWRFLAPATLVFCVLLIVFWPGPRSSRLRWAAHGIAIAALMFSGWLMAAVQYERAGLLPSARSGQDAHSTNLDARDANEYLPRQADLAAAREQMGESRARILQGAGEVSVLEWQARRIRLRVEAAGSAEVVVRQFYYPGWTGTTAGGQPLGVEPDPKTGLIRLRVPEGERTVALRLVAGPAEKAGWAITLLTIVGLAAGPLFKLRRARRCVQPGGAR